VESSEHKDPSGINDMLFLFEPVGAELRIAIRNCNFDKAMRVASCLSKNVVRLNLKIEISINVNSLSAIALADVVTAIGNFSGVNNSVITSNLINSNDIDGSIMKYSDVVSTIQTSPDITLALGCPARRLKFKQLFELDFLRTSDIQKFLGQKFFSAD
jgi:hypothetical protein